MPPRQVVYKPTGKPKEIYAGGGITPPKFMPTYYEWLMSKGELIKIWHVKSSGTKTAYTVPKDKILYVSNLFWSVNCTGTGAGNGYAQLIILDFANQNISWQNDYDLAVYSFDNTPLTFPTPLKLGENVKIEIGSNSAALRSSVLIYGFLVSKKNLPVL